MPFFAGVSFCFSRFSGPFGVGAPSFFLKPFLQTKLKINIIMEATTNKLTAQEIMLEIRDNLKMPTVASTVLSIKYVKDNTQLLAVLGIEFIRASYIRASSNDVNHKYVSWQLERNADSTTIIGEANNYILMRVGTSMRYYYINTDTMDVLAIENRLRGW